MLFISILLSVWFVLWLAYAVYVKDLGKVIVAWLEDMYDEDEDLCSDELLEKADRAYHLSCSHCNHLWWSNEGSPNYCPNCGEKLKGE